MPHPKVLRLVFYFTRLYIDLVMEELITFVSSCKSRYIISRLSYNVFVAQWVESCYPTRKVRGSSPTTVIFFVAFFHPFG